MRYIENYNRFGDDDPRRFKGFDLNKEELDKLSYKEVLSLKVYMIEKSIDDYKRKTDEVELYMKIRFKEREIDMYNEWERKSKITKKVSKADGFYDDFYHDEQKDGYFTQTEMDTFKLLTELIDKFGGQDAYYNMMLDQDKSKLGESKYGLY